MHTLKIALFLLILISTSSKAITEINYMVIQDQAQPFQNHQNKKHHTGIITDIVKEIFSGPEYEVKVLLNTIDMETPALTQEDFRNLYEAVLEDYSHIKGKRKQAEAIKNNEYYNALQIKFAYAITCHKAQGGQWKSVFVDQGYLTEEMIDKSYLRWIYTALTRASDRLHLVNFDKKFFK